MIASITWLWAFTHNSCKCLGVRKTANNNYFDIDYDIRIFDDPNEMKRELEKKNTNNKANSNCMIGIAPGAAVKRSMAPWRVIRLVAWILVGGLALADAVVIALIWLDKIKVAEKVKAIKETESAEEF